MLVHQNKKKRRRRLKINKNLLHQARKLTRKNQAQFQPQVKLQVQVNMRVVMMKKRKMMIKQVVAPQMILKKSRNVSKELRIYSRSSTQRVSLQLVSYNQIKKNKKRNVLVVAKRDTT